MSKMTEIMRVLRREHDNITKLLEALERQIVVLDEAGEPDYDIIDGVIDYFLSYPDLYHHPKEELVFAKLRERDPAAAEAVGDLKCEHEEIAARTREFAARMRAALEQAGAPRGSLGQWAHDFIGLQKRHLTHEEEVFFPQALNALTSEDWVKLEARMTDEDDPLFGSDVGERYKALHRDILEWDRQTAWH
jgi:hemerythrin-like domain-containing protein